MNNLPNQILLVGNFPVDRQQSMLRFGDLMHKSLCEMLKDSARVELIAPKPLLTKLFGLSNHRCNMNRGSVFRELGKWLGYADKFVLFPLMLSRKLSEARRRNGKGNFLVHITDHSNAVYTRYLKKTPFVVTCHDLLAVRSALGEFKGQTTRWSGQRLQQMILNGLKRSPYIITDSQATKSDVMRLAQHSEKNVECVYLSLSYPYSPMPPGTSYARFAEMLQECCAPSIWTETLDQPLLLHVGGDQWYKNRSGVVEIFAALNHSANKACKLILVGPSMTRDLEDKLNNSGLRDRVLVFSNLTNEDLRTLYSVADALLFPSIAEGFGWPIIEAQACGCRVITSNRAPMTEVGGESCVYIDPDNLTVCVSQIISMLAEGQEDRHRRIQSGFQNLSRFSVRNMTCQYLEMYQRILSESSRL